MIVGRPRPPPSSDTRVLFFSFCRWQGLTPVSSGCTSPVSLAAYQASARSPLPLSLTEISTASKNKQRRSGGGIEIRVTPRQKPQLKVKTNFTVPKDDATARDATADSLDRRILAQQLQMMAPMATPSSNAFRAETISPSRSPTTTTDETTTTIA